MLSASSRPCILAGTGIVSANVRDEFEDFVDRLKIPVIAGGWCTDAIYTDHPLYYGLSGDIAPRARNFILQNADTISVLGNSLSFRQTGYAQEKFAPNAKILWVEVDENESKKPGMRYDRFVRSDLGVFLKQQKKINIDFQKLDPKWRDYCKELKSRFTPYESIENNTIDPDARVNSYYFWKVFDDQAAEDVIIAMGNSRANAAKIQIGVEKKQQRAITKLSGFREVVGILWF